LRECAVKKKGRLPDGVCNRIDGIIEWITAQTVKEYAKFVVVKIG
jgi:hypothetical protein